ncbi:MAG: MBL fold metallo-hydrolase, partial [Chitinophagaceae bacterium]
PIQQSGQLRFVHSHIDRFDKNGKILSTPFNDYISLRFVNGHTDAMMLPQIKYKEHTILYMADLLPSAAHLPLPYVMAYDMQPLITLQEKESVLNEALNENYILFFEHDPIIECCTLQMTEKGIRMKDAFTLESLSA